MQSRQGGQGVAQAGQLARAHRAQRHAVSMVAMACWRASTGSFSRRGWCSQRRSSRLPMGVRQPSSSENSVGDSSPLRVWVSSRLRRVTGSSSTYCPERSAAMVCTCASACDWVRAA
ncbi:Uncharacterised protein [Bordetella pertussis]|nr:Uncharacterised protein [Bordetella pertussis]